MDLAFRQFEDDRFVWRFMRAAIREGVIGTPVNIDNMVAEYEQGYHGDRVSSAYVLCY